jgi:hypothetical protein
MELEMRFVLLKLFERGCGAELLSAHLEEAKGVECGGGSWWV